MTRIVTLGDSITLGMGDPAPGGGWRGWACFLATGLPKPELHNLATNGAQAKHIERDQLPNALLLRPHVATVVVGINDTLRAGFDPVRTGQAAARTVAALTANGATVITMRLPDPAQMFGLPSALARPLSRRMRAVNAELDRIAAHYGTVHWDASTDPETYDRRNWSVDRLHPNERGHRLIDHLLDRGLLLKRSRLDRPEIRRSHHRDREQHDERGEQDSDSPVDPGHARLAPG